MGATGELADYCAQCTQLIYNRCQQGVLKTSVGGGGTHFSFAGA